LIVKDNEAKDKLVSTVINLAKDEALQQQLKQNIIPLAITNADETIAKEILNTIK
jgi:UDP-N-acetylglucosamine--N-acetylmuramyl-(pentapeptide) pyrophosphoryl-undecaprenol N-acetylglucosamine transferase